MYPFDLHGPEFLNVYTVSLISTTAIAALYRAKEVDTGTTCSNHPLQIEPNPYEIGYLRAGQSGVIEAAVAALVQSKVLDPSGGSVRIDKSAKYQDHLLLRELVGRLPARDTEAKDLRELTESWKHRKLHSLDQIKIRLEKGGFVLTEDASNRIRLISTTIALMPLTIGVPKVFIGISLHKPVWFLVLLISLTLLVAMLYGIRRPVRTLRGEQALDNLTRSQSALKTNAYYNPDGLSVEQVATAAALFGTSIFACGMVSEFYKRLAPPSSGGSGCGSSCSVGVMNDVIRPGLNGVTLPGRIESKGVALDIGQS